MSKDSVHRSGSDEDPPQHDDPQARMIAEAIHQLKRHLPIESWDKLVKELGHVTVHKQQVPLKLIAPHIDRSLFPITTAEDLEKKVDVHVRRAVALARSGAIRPNAKVFSDLLLATHAQLGKGSLRAPRQSYEFRVRMRSIVEQPFDSDKGDD